MRRVRLAPSIMCADFMNLQREIDVFQSAQIELLHIDVMDGHYVPNFTLGPGFCGVLADNSNIPLDIHLMIENPDAYVPAFARFAGAWVSFHPEACYHPLRTIELIRSHGAKAGVAVAPATPLESIEELLAHVDFACAMTVNPGFAGQKLLPGMIARIERLASIVSQRGLATHIEADGNVSWQNIPAIVAAGADTLVLGSSSLYDGEADLGRNIRRIRDLVGKSGKKENEDE